jgi:hypothetical protein
MNNLPSEIFACIFHHLDAFDAHRFGLTHHRALQVINSERERAHERSHYDRWYDDVEKRTMLMVDKWSKVYAEDPNSEYAPCLQRAIQQCYPSYWSDQLWELITGTYYDGDDLDLENFAISMVEGFESVIINSWQGLRRCTVCGLLNTEFIYDQHSNRRCLTCD